MFTLVTTHSLILIVDCATKEQRASCLPADEERVTEAVSRGTKDAPVQAPPAETQSDNPKEEPSPVSEQGPENMEVEKEDKQETTPSVEQEVPSEPLKNGSKVTHVPPPSSKDPPKLPSSPASVDKTEHSPMDNRQERSPCPDPQSPSPHSISGDTQEALSSMDMERRLLPHSEEEDDDDEYDEQMKGDGLIEDIKREPDDLSYLSHGDESSSGFLGSPGEQDPQLSMELGHSHADNLLSETDDSLPFEPLREKVKRRGSPGRSRVKQVGLSLLKQLMMVLN